METYLRQPKIDDPRYDQAVEFIKMYLRGDHDTHDFLRKVNLGCQSLREDYPKAPEVWHISSIIERMFDNIECSKYFIARAIRLGLDEQDTRAILDKYIDEDILWGDTEGYLRQSQSIDTLIEYYVSKAHHYFNKGDFDCADIYSQRVSALNNPLLSQLVEIPKLRDETKIHNDRNTLDQHYKSTIDILHQHWTNIALDNSDVEKNIHKYNGEADRLQMAEEAVKWIRATEKRSPAILEIGCFAGGLLNEIYKSLSSDEDISPRLVGVEPNENITVEAGKLLPHIEFHVGDHKSLVSYGLNLPELIDVCIISRVFSILMPDDVEQTLEFLSSRTHFLIICDDIFNLNGEQTMVRMPSNFFLVHNFRDKLENNGFMIEDVIMANVPHREFTGIIIAKGRQN